MDEPGLEATDGEFPANFITMALVLELEIYISKLSLASPWALHACPKGPLKEHGGPRGRHLEG